MPCFTFIKLFSCFSKVDDFKVFAHPHLDGPQGFLWILPLLDMLGIWRAWTRLLVIGYRRAAPFISLAISKSLHAPLFNRNIYMLLRLKDGYKAVTDTNLQKIKKNKKEKTRNNSS